MDSNTMREAVTPRETIELLKSLVRIPSVNGCEEAVALWLNDLFQELGLETSLYEVEPHRPAVVGVLPRETSRETADVYHPLRHPCDGQHGDPSF